MGGDARLRTNRAATGALALGLAALAGCSKEQGLLGLPVYEVSGRVLRGDGQPVSRGRVVFIPVEETAIQAYGELSPDGSFRLKTRGSEEGAVAGRYRVRIDPAFEDLRGPQGLRQLKFPYKYTDEDSSGLLVTVKPEANRLEPFRLR